MAAPRARAPELTRDQRLRIVTLYRDANWSYSEVLRHLQQAGLPQLTRHQVVRACTGPPTPQKPGRVGSKVKVTEEQKAQLKAFLTEHITHRALPWSHIPHFLEGFEQVHDVAISRALRDLGYRRMPRRRKIQLTESHKAARLQWALEYKDFTADDWGSVLFSDETWATGASAYREWLTIHETEDPDAWAAVRLRPNG